MGSLSDLHTSMDTKEDIGELEENKIFFYTMTSWTLLTLVRLLAMPTIREQSLFWFSIYLGTATIQEWLLFESGV